MQRHQRHHMSPGHTHTRCPAYHTRARVSPRLHNHTFATAFTLRTNAPPPPPPHTHRETHRPPAQDARSSEARASRVIGSHAWRGRRSAPTALRHLASHRSSIIRPPHSLSLALPPTPAQLNNFDVVFGCISGCSRCERGSRFNVPAAAAARISFGCN